MPISYKAPERVSTSVSAEPLLMDVIRLDMLGEFDPQEILPFVVYSPWDCPGWCGQKFALLISKPVELEVTQGLVGDCHLQILKAHMERLCTEENPCMHVRTDGISAWSLR